MEGIGILEEADSFSVLTYQDKRDILDLASKLQSQMFRCWDLPAPGETLFLDFAMMYATLMKRVALQVRKK